MEQIDEKISLCQSTIEYIFQNKHKCLEALQASGQAIWWGDELLHPPKNDRLAVFGDAIAKAYLCELWLATTLSKGQWVTALGRLDNKDLAAEGFERGLDEAIILNDGTTAVSNGQMATTMEAIVAAVYLDGGQHALGRVLDNLDLIHPSIRAVKLT